MFVMIRKALAYVDLYGIAVCEPAHLTLGEQSVREQRKQYEFGQSKQLVSREIKSCAPIRELALGRKLSSYKAHLRSIAIVSSAPTSPRVLMGGPPCCT